MFTAKQYRAKAAEYTELLKAASLPAEIREFRRLERSYLTLAENEEWMADNLEKINRPGADENGMATPSSPSKGRIRSDAMGSQRSRLRSQQRFSSSSMTPVPWAAYCKQRRYGDRSPASYTSIRSTTFAESHPALLTRNALEARFRFSIGLRGVAARDVLKNHFRMFNFIQTAIRASAYHANGGPCRKRIPRWPSYIL